MNDLLFLRPLLRTVLIEAAAVWLIGIRNRKDLMLVVLVNVLTNPLLHLFARLFRMVLSGTAASVLVLAVLELLVVLAEGWIYEKGSEISHPYRISLILNMCSLTGGLLWSFL